MPSAMEPCSLLRIDLAIPSEWRCTGGRVARARMRATQGRRRNDQMVAGVTPATRFRGGGCRLAAAGASRARERGKRAQRGAPDYPERDGEVAGAWEGRRRPGWCSPAAESCGGRGQIRRLRVFPASASQRGRTEGHGGASGLLAGARGCSEQRQSPAALRARVRVRGGKREKEQRLGFLAAAAGLLIALGTSVARIVARSSGGRHRSRQRAASCREEEEDRAVFQKTPWVSQKLQVSFKKQALGLEKNYLRVFL